jgi:pSer/pThr/pTyr-binding forkhead associated (FHA) protein
MFDQPGYGANGGISIGRSTDADVSLDWDSDASRAHAELRPVADVWTVIDDGLSRNGTYVNGERIQGRRRLADGDTLRCGKTLIWYRDPADTSRASTASAVDSGPCKSHRPRGGCSSPWCARF